MQCLFLKIIIIKMRVSIADYGIYCPGTQIKNEAKRINEFIVQYRGSGFCAGGFYYSS